MCSRASKMYDTIHSIQVVPWSPSGMASLFEHFTQFESDMQIDPETLSRIDDEYDSGSPSRAGSTPSYQI